MRQCRLCHNQAEQLRRQRERGLLTKRRFRQYLTSLKNQRTGRGVERVYLDLVQQFGGTEGLLRTWKHTIEKDLAAGGFKAYRHIASILRLMEYREDAQPDRPDYSTMSDEELLDRLARAEVCDNEIARACPATGKAVRSTASNRSGSALLSAGPVSMKPQR